MRISPKPCGICAETFSTPGALYEHRELTHQFQEFADGLHELGARPDFAEGFSLEAVVLTVTSEWHFCKIHHKGYQYYPHFVQHVLNEHVCHECGVLVEDFAPHNREFHPVSEQCQHCGNIFPCGGLEPHLQQTQCDKLRCFKCNRRVSHISEMEHHRDHLCPGRDVACGECGAEMPYRRLEEHNEYHRWEARERERQARERERLSRTVAATTQPVLKTVPCPFCGKLFKTVQGASDHSRQVHPDRFIPTSTFRCLP